MKEVRTNKRQSCSFLLEFSYATRKQTQENLLLRITKACEFCKAALVSLPSVLGHVCVPVILPFTDFYKYSSDS